MISSNECSNSREDKLPKWAREELKSLRHQLKLEKEKSSKLEEASEILNNRNWFTIQGPKFTTKEKRNLWYLDFDNPTCICSLGRGDVLLVGRKRSILQSKENDSSKIKYFALENKSYKNGCISFLLNYEIEKPDSQIIPVLILEPKRDSIKPFNVVFKAELEFNGFVYHGEITLGDSVKFTECK